MHGPPGRATDAHERELPCGVSVEDVISALCSATVALGSAHGLVREQPDRAATRLEWVVGVLDDVMAELRHGWRPPLDPQVDTASDRRPDGEPGALIELPHVVAAMSGQISDRLADVDAARPPSPAP
jgi:hypothetical protein